MAIHETTEAFPAATASTAERRSLQDVIARQWFTHY